MAIDIESLKRVQYFAGCTPEEYEYLKDFITQETVMKGGIFLFEGEWSDYLYFLISGVVKVYKTSSDGKEQILHIVHEGESLNDVSTFDGGPNAASMLAMTPTVMYKMKKSDMKAVLRNHPRIVTNILKALASRVRRDSMLVGDLSFTQVTGRLAKVLLKLGGEEADYWPRLTQQDLAAMIGTTREVVNRSLRVMEERGAIRLDRHGVVVTNAAILDEMVRSST
jgi:CRP-like cAMP-binding protein